MIIYILLLIGGLVLLVKGADWFVDGSAFLARKANIKELTIGLTIVAFGTSAPELVVNGFASLNGHEGIVYGNIIGSNNFNIYMILGISGLIIPISVQSSTVKKEIPLSFFGTCLFLVLVNDWIYGEPNILSRVDSLILLIFFLALLTYIFINAKNEQVSGTTSDTKTNDTKSWKLLLLIFGGLACLIYGGKLVVDNAVNIAEALNMSQKVIGLTIVAAGTSLPELATSVISALKGNNDIAIGNVIGSNFWNIFFILSISGLINPLEYDLSLNREVLFLLGGTALLLLTMFTGKSKKLDRWEAAIMVVVFSSYLIYIIINS